jgi:hypothetical protein
MTITIDRLHTNCQNKGQLKHTEWVMQQYYPLRSQSIAFYLPHQLWDSGYALKKLTRISSLFISWDRVLYDMKRLIPAESCHDCNFGFSRSRISLHFSSIAIIAGIFGLAITTSVTSPLYGQFTTPVSPALRGFPPSSMFSDEGVIPMCSDISITYIPISSIGMMNCPPSTVPVVMITSPPTFSGTSSNSISLCTYTVNSEFGSFEFGLTPTITLTNCVFVSPHFPPLAADTIVSPAMTNFPSFGFPTTLFP